MSTAEQYVLTEMGQRGLGRGIEAVCDLLFKLGYIDVSRELLTRWLSDCGHDEFFYEDFEPDEPDEPTASAADATQIDGAGI